MTLRERWGALPADIRFGCLAATAFGAWFAVCVLGGPHLFLFVSSCLMYVLLAVVALVLLFRFVASPRWSRAIVLAVISGGLASRFAAPDATVDLHLILRIYLAGGPNSLNTWGQELIREQQNKPDSREVEPERIPQGVRDYLPGWLTVDGRANHGHLRIELGGGFYHYGVLVLPKGSVQAERWQRVLGWPPEVAIYHED